MSDTLWSHTSRITFPAFNFSLNRSFNRAYTKGFTAELNVNIMSEMSSEADPTCSVFIDFLTRHTTKFHIIKRNYMVAWRYEMSLLALKVSF